MYKKLTLKTKLLLAGAVIYLILPTDIIPDVFPVLGQIDDVAFFGFAAKSLLNDLKSYKKIKKLQ